MRPENRSRGLPWLSAQPVVIGRSCASCARRIPFVLNIIAAGARLLLGFLFRTGDRIVAVEHMFQNMPGQGGALDARGILAGETQGCQLTQPFFF